MQELAVLITGPLGQAALAGAMGGLVRWLALKEKARDGMVSVMVGTICAVYLGPIAQPLLEPAIGSVLVDPTEKAGFSGFLIGLGGLSVTGFFIDFWRAWRRGKK